MVLRSNRKTRSGFTLVELLVVIVVLAVLAAIVLPKFVDSGRRSKESALRSDLKLYRNAITLFRTDTGYYPATLADLAATSKPANGLDDAAASKTLGDWHGPYVQSIENDPVSGGVFQYTVTSPGVGTLKPAATTTGNGLDGTAYSTW